MASAWLRNLLRASSLLRSSPASACSFRPILLSGSSILSSSKHLLPGNPANTLWSFRNFSYGSVNFVLAEGKPKFETHEVDPPKKEKWKNKKRFQLQKKREKEKRKAANKKDPRRLGKKRKQKFANAEERIKYKLDKARIKETLLIEKLKRYEVPKVQGPVVEPDNLTGEERFFLKKMGQKKSNYVPLGRRGVFGGVILNMHMHWKKHETVKVICKPCKPGQVHDYAQEIARLSGGIPIQIVGDDTIIFYRGRNYVQPEIMSPIDTLSKKRALEKSKYEQSLESVRRFIAIAEKELELYYRHTALYGDPNSRNPIAILDSPVNGTIGSKEVDSSKRERQCVTDDSISRDYSPLDSDFSDLSETESEDGSKDDMSISESDAGYGHIHDIGDEREENFLGMGGHSTHDSARSSSSANGSYDTS
ncbi:uncharacterized CRM domain-containing protein At3g25440, chloroplastic isoform X2 [Rhodamnia argentea]|uniref:Uncharacterized CRM domain-containing protein At3g25440, chloroplastic isoform X2 n=1 Tax=Rhodamnia argentea TaxID=178133 RepID=A0ABM3GSA3_9MYRT|nr:uncharacterized CRM domain-containing protein At3g25440, chloroplastic isoform X2 [Rhodamnia argentea]